MVGGGVPDDKLSMFSLQSLMSQQNQSVQLAGSVLGTKQETTRNIIDKFT